jgi:hypothetical protein
MGNKFASSRRRTNEEIYSLTEPRTGPILKGIRTQNSRNPGKGLQPKKKVTVIEEPCTNTKVHSLSKRSHDHSAVNKSLLHSASVHNIRTLGRNNRSDNSPGGAQQVRLRRDQIPVKDSEIQIYGKEEIKENCSNGSFEYASVERHDSGAHPTSANMIRTLSTLFITHSDDVFKTLSRLETNQTRPTELSVVDSSS